MNSFITTREAARRLNISIRRVQALIAGGRLPAEKIGHSFAIRPSDLRLAYERKNGRPASSVRSEAENNRESMLNRILGRVSFGPADLSTNKKHFEGYGRD